MENYLAEQKLPFTVAHPLYLYGAHTAKDCEQWFMDRVLRCVCLFVYLFVHARAGALMIWTAARRPPI